MVIFADTVAYRPLARPAGQFQSVTGAPVTEVSFASGLFSLRAKSEGDPADRLAAGLGDGHDMLPARAIGEQDR